MFGRSACLAALVTIGALAWPSPAPAVQRGGAVTFLAAADVDYIDPGQTYYTFGYMVAYAVHRPLYSFRPEDGVNPVPDLAVGPPEISADQKTITVRIRGGVRYAPPVNREVRAADVEYAIERAFTRNVASGYATSYFRDIDGAPARAGAYRDIPGVQAIDDRTLVLRLTAPTAFTVAAALVMPITAPVPREYAQPFDARNPSTYDRNATFTGPYMVRNDASGRLVGRRPGRIIELVRNPNWDPATDFRPAYLDAITIDEGNDDLTLASRRALSGSGLMCCDSGQPPIRVLARALRSNPGQVGRTASGGTRWIALNTRRKPFNNVNVRRAVAAGMDRRALLLTRGGSMVGTVAKHYLPPGLPGFNESGGLGGFGDIDFLARAGGNRALMRSYFRKAGFKRGRYTGRRRLLMIATNADPGRTTAKLAARQLRRMGFRIRLRHVPQDVLYTRHCGVRRSRYAICPNVGWFRDYSDAEPMLSPTFSGRAIPAFGNVNWSHLRVPRIDQAIEAARLVPPGPDRDRAWAAVNHDVTALAPAVPYAWEDSFTVFSANVESVTNAFTTTPDLSFSGLR